MCNPAIIPYAIALIGAGVSAHGQIEQGKAEKRIAKSNAQLSEQAAVDASRRGAIDEEAHRAKVRALLGAQRATYGANNVVSSSGSPLGLLAETAQVGEFDALTIRNNAARETFGFRTDRQSALARARAASRGSRTGALGTALTAGAQAYGSWKSANPAPRKASA